MLSIEEILLLIEKLEKIKGQDLQKVIDDNLKLLKDVATAVEANDSDRIARLDKTPEWFARDLEWRYGNIERKELLEDKLLFEKIYIKIKQFSKMLGEFNSLEIGPGYGKFSTCFGAWRLNYFLDILPQVKEKIFKRFKSEHHKHLKFCLTPWHSCDEIPDNSIHFVFSWDTFTFFSQMHIRRYLKDIFRVTLPGGHILLHYTNCEFDHDLNEAKRGYWSYNTKSAMIKMVKDSGYNVIETEQFAPGANYIIFQKPGNLNPVLYKTFEIPETK